MFKANLLPQGDTQAYGIDYRKTFGTAANMNIIRIVMSIAAHPQCPQINAIWEMHSFVYVSILTCAYRWMDGWMDRWKETEKKKRRER